MQYCEERTASCFYLTSESSFKKNMATFAHDIIYSSTGLSSCCRPKHQPSSYKPLRITMVNNQPYLTSISKDVEAHIDRVLSRRQPPNVVEPMHRIALATPRSMGSALCVAACELVGGGRKEAIPVASALHLMQSAAFTRENLLLSDQRNSSALHEFETNIELLTGDCLMPLAYEIVADLGNEQTQISERVLRVIIEISTTMGSQGMVEGQYLQKQHIMGPIGGGSSKWLYYFCEKKEGGLYACSSACGAILGGGSDVEINTLRRLGYLVGMIDGMMKHGEGAEEKELSRMVEHFRRLALEKLDFFHDKNIDTMKNLLDLHLPRNQPSSKSDCYM